MSRIITQAIDDLLKQICSCLPFFRWVLLGISLAENRRRGRKIKKKKAAESTTDFKWAEDMRNSRLERAKVFDISILGIITSTQTERQGVLDDFANDDENATRTEEENDEEEEKQSDETEEDMIFKGTRYKKQRRDGKGNKSFSNHRLSKKRQKEETSDSEEGF